MKRAGANRRIFFWIIFALALEFIIVLWPLTCTISGIGYLNIWQTSWAEGPVRDLMLGVGFGMVAGLVFGLIYGIVFGLALSLISSIIVAFGSNLFIVLGYGLMFGLVFGLVFSLGYGIISGLLLGLIFGFTRGFIIGPGVTLGVLVGILSIHWLRHVFITSTSFGTWFLNTRRLRTHHFSEILKFLTKALMLFIVVYLGIVLVFSLWFYAVYLEDRNSFRTKHDQESEALYEPDSTLSFRDKQATMLDWMDFAYYSLMSITNFGGGDINPAQTLSYFLEIAELMLELGWILIYFGIIINMVMKIGSGKRQKPKREMTWRDRKNLKGP